MILLVSKHLDFDENWVFGINSVSFAFKRMDLIDLKVMAME